MRSMCKRLTMKSASIAATVLLAAGALSAQAATTTVNLTAQRMSTTLPDGGIVPMWGYCTNDLTNTTPATTNAALGGGHLLGANVCSTPAVAPATAPVVNTTWAPGPTIVVPAGNQLTINLTNNLTAGTSTSLVILGQIGGSAGNPTRDAAPTAHSTVGTTTWNANVPATGPSGNGINPFTPPAQAARARAFAQEAGFGGAVSYTWNTVVGSTALAEGGTASIYLKPGTYLYETGSHPSLQAPMGLYGVLIVTTQPIVEPAFALTGGNPNGVNEIHLNTAGQAFPGAYSTYVAPSPLATLHDVPYDADATLLLSEIDAVQNAAVDAAAVAGTSETLRWNDPNCLQSQKEAPVGAQVPCYPAAVNYAPTYFLVNGKPFDQTNPAATAIALPDYLGSDGGALSGNVLVRWVNAGLRVHVPSIVGLPMQLIAEDGNVAPGNPKQQAEVNMPAGKTVDAIVRPASSSTGNTDTNGYTDAVYAFFDRELSTSTGNQTKGGYQGYLAITSGQIASSTGAAHVTALNGVIGASHAAAVVAKANADNYTLSPNATSFSNNVLANDIGVSGALIQGQALLPGATSTTLTLIYGTVVLNTNGTFTYTVGPVAPALTPLAPTTFPTSDTFTYCGNGGAACALVTLTFEAIGGAPVAANRTYDNSATTAFPSNVASVIMVPRGAGVLVGATDPTSYPLTAQFPANSTPPAWVTLNADGSFTATPCATALPATCTFNFVAVNSQGTASAPATATIVFPVGSGLPVNLVDAQSGAPVVADYGWIIEEDQTWHNPTPGVTPAFAPGAAPPPSLATSFHRSHMPIVAAGCTGPLSCRDAQTFNGVAGSQYPRSLPSDVVLDPTKYYYISFLPGDAANPVVSGFNKNPLDPAYVACLTPSAPGKNDAACGHTIGGAAIAPLAVGTTAYAPMTVKVEPNPLKPARLSIYIFEDNAPTNGDPDALEHGLGGFEVVVWDVGGHSGDPVGQVTYDTFNEPLTNALLGTPGCPNVASPTPSAATSSNPSYAGKDLTGVVFTCPNDPVDPTNPSPEYALQGMALINNLMPGRYDVIAHPGAEREGRGERWFQVSTLEGTPGQDAFTKSGEPPYFQEFGPPGFHTFIGFVNPAHIQVQNQVAINPGASLGVADGGEPVEVPPVACAPPAVCNPLQTTTISGRITSLHMSRPVMETLWDSASRAPLSSTTCFVSLNQQGETGLNIGFATCDAQGNFSIDSVPVGNYMLAIWDQWLDQIIAFKAVQVTAGPTPDANGNPVPSGPVAMGDIPVFSWFTRVETSIFFDQAGTGIQTPSDPGIAQVPVRIRFRDGSISNTLLTDSSGNAVFNELFPLFNWYVVESDRARFAGTGVNVTVDAGGLPDCVTYVPATGQGTLGAANTNSALPCSISGGILNSSYVWTNPITGLPFGAVPSGASTSTNRIDAGSTKYEGLQGFINQTQILNWGKRQFNVGENGGIEGMVVYASTRGFDDPSLEVQFMWEPGVPRVKINLYREIANADGTTGLLLVNSTNTTSWDDYAAGTTAAGTPNLVCPGQDPNDPFLTYTLGAANQFKCYDGFHLWNQVQPAVYDGAYSIEQGYPYGMDASGNPLAAPVGATNALSALPAGKYVVEMVLPEGYEVVKEEDKNILIGDAWVAPLAQQFGGGILTNIYIQPDQASVAANYNPNNPNANNTTARLGFSGAKTIFPLCVGTMHTVPDYLSLFPNSGQVAPFAGMQKPLCDRKEVVLNDQMTGVANFHVFSDTPRAAHFTGLILDDAATEINSASPDFGEKFAVSYSPVSLKDMNGVEISRVYSDQWGTYNGVVFSTWQVNVPNPAGYSPNMLVTCMNDPGPILDTRAGSPTFGQMITDPLFNPSFSNFCYTNPFMPGTTVYLDTPVVPVAAFADGYNPPDCSYQDATPAIKRVDGDAIGPWVLATGPRQITITALGPVEVQNPLYQGPSATAAPWNQRTITRTYSFGSTPGTVTVNGTALTNVTWSDLAITGTIPAGVTSGELQITNANGQASVDTVTVNIESVAPVVVEPATGTSTGFGYTHPVQDAIDAANPGDLIVLDAGSYPELVIMWKPVRLQGVGAASVTINASKYPTQKLEEWRPRINKLFGLDVTQFSGNQQLDAGASTELATNPQVDPLPTQTPITGGVTLLEPTILATEEGAGITVLAKGLAPDGTTPLTSNDCTSKGGGVFAGAPGSAYYAVTATNNSVASQATLTPTGWNMADSNFRCAPSRIDGVSITGSDAGGGIYVNGWAHGLEISNNRIFSNASAMHGGMRIGSPFEEETPPGASGYGYDDNVSIHHNWISKNGTSEYTPGVAGSINMTGAGAGVSICTGSDNFQVNYNFICGNYSNGDGGGLGVLGASLNGLISHNQILFNQSAQQTAPVHGGGITIEGDLTTAGSVSGISNGTGNITIDSNLILGNYSQDGHGGGIRLSQVNGNDVASNPTDPTKWYVATVSNNVIVNNVAGWAGGGISLVDTLNAQIVDNTIADNDSISSVGSLFGTGGRGPTTAYPSPAGISTDLTASALLAVLPVAGPGIPVNATKTWNAYSNPVLFNDIIWHNRSFFVDARTGTTNVCSSNVVADAGVNCTVLPAQTWAGQCTGSPAYWDLGAVGDASAAASNAAFSNVLNSVASPAGFPAGVTGLSTADPGLVQPYCNGARANPALKFEPGQPFLPPFALNAGVTLDEAGNFVDVKFGPLSLNDPLQPGTVFYGNYSILNTGSAFNGGAAADAIAAPNAAAPTPDYAGNARPDPARAAPNGYDVGALQYAGATAASGNANVGVIPASLTFNVAAGAAPTSKVVTVFNTSTTAVLFGTTPVSFTVSDATITQTNTCGASLASGGSCQITVTFAPIATTVSANATLTVAFAAGQGATVPAALNVPVTAATGSVTITAPAAFANQGIGTTSAAQSATLTNTGAVAVPITGVTLTGTNPGDFTLPGGGTCAGAVPVAASCTINVAFAPTAVGARAATLNVTLGGGTVLSAGLSGTGAALNYAWSVTTLAFGNVPVGTASAAQTVTLTNNGVLPLPVVSFKLTGTNAVEFTLTPVAPCTSATSLATAGTCTFSVVMTPASAGGKAATLIGPASTPSVSLTGTGVGPSLVLAPSPLTFPTQGIGTTSAPLDITVTNNSTLGTLTLSNIAVAPLAGLNPDQFAVLPYAAATAATAATSTCLAPATALAAPVAPATAGGTCTVSVTFSPTYAIAIKRAILTVTASAGGAGPVSGSVALVGTGQVATYTVTPSPVAFGNQGVGVQSVALSATVTNTSTAAPLFLAASNIAITGANATEFTVLPATTCGVTPTVAAGASCTISLAFTPSASGAHTATLALTPTQLAAAQSVPLTGTGVAATYVLTPSPAVLPNTQIGSASTPATVITLTNNSAVPAILSGINVTVGGINAAEFAQTNTCGGASLAVNQTCQINVTFTPTVANLRRATINVTAGGGSLPASVAVSGTGVTPSASLTGNGTFANEQTGTTSAASTFTYTNTGIGPITVATVGLNGGNAANFAVPAASNTCVVNGAGVTLAPAASCTIGVTFTPSAAGGRSTTLRVTDTTPYGAPAQNLLLSGTGVAPSASLTGNGAFANEQVGTTSAASTFTYTNTGIGPITVATVGLNGGNAANFAVPAASNACVVNGAGVTLAPTASCTIGVTFTPTGTGLRTTTLRVTDTAGGAPAQNLLLTGTGVAPSASLTGNGAFGNQQVGTTSAASTFTYTNTGIGPITVATVGLNGGNAANFAVPAASNACVVSGVGVTLAPATSCTIGVTFTPSATGLRTTTLRVTDAAGGAPLQNAALSGTGVQAVVAISAPAPSLVRAGNTRAARSGDVTVSNTGNGPLTFAAANAFSVNRVTGTGTFATVAPATGTACQPSMVLAAGAACTIGVSYTPPAAPAGVNASARITLNDAGAATASQNGGIFNAN